MSADIVRPNWLGPKGPSLPNTTQRHDQAFRDLEPLIRNCERAAILAERETVETCDTDDFEMVLFAVSQVRNMLTDLRTEYYRLHKGS